MQRKSTPTAETDIQSLFLRYASELRAYLVGQVQCRHTASDLVQDTFERYALQPDRSGARNNRAYLYRIAHNLAIDHFRGEQRRRTDLRSHEELADLVCDAPLPERRLEGKQNLERLQRALGGLPALTQQIFRLNRVDGLTYAAIARELAISESSVQKHLARALQCALCCRREFQDGPHG